MMRGVLFATATIRLSPREVRMERKWWIVLALAVAAQPALAQQQQQRVRQDCQPNTPVRQQTTGTPGPDQRFREFDVVLDVPELCVERITLKVTNLRAHLALDAAVANLLQIQAGADVSIARVDLGIHGVRAQALLLVDLDNVVYAVDRTLTFIDNNPEVVRGVLRSVNNTVGVVGGLGNTLLQPGGVVSQTVGVVGQTAENLTAPGGLLSQTVNTLGQTVTRVVDQTGSILERTLSTTGQVLNSRTLGNVLSLPVINTTTSAAGETVRQVRDSSGAVIEYVVDTAGKVLRTRVLSGARR
jgi:hypothetical protein